MRMVERTGGGLNYNLAAKDATAKTEKKTMHYSRSLKKGEKHNRDKNKPTLIIYYILSWNTQALSIYHNLHYVI